MVRRIERPLAVYLTWIVLHFPISANQVTFISIIAGIVGGILIASGGPVVFLMGVLLFHLWYLLDHVDGQVARFKNQASLSGVYFDYISHYIVHTAFFLGVGFQAFFSSQSFFYLFFALAAAFGSIGVGIFYDTRYKAMFHQLTKSKQATWIGYEDPLKKLEQEQQINHMPLKKIFILLYKSTEIHVALNIVTVIALINLKWHTFLGVPWAYWLTLFYGAAFPILFILRIYRHITGRRIEGDFGQYFRVD